MNKKIKEMLKMGIIKPSRKYITFFEKLFGDLNPEKNKFLFGDLLQVMIHLFSHGNLKFEEMRIIYKIRKLKERKILAWLESRDFVEIGDSELFLSTFPLTFELYIKTPRKERKKEPKKERKYNFNLLYLLQNRKKKTISPISYYYNNNHRENCKKRKNKVFPNPYQSEIMEIIYFLNVIYNSHLKENFIYKQKIKMSNHEKMMTHRENFFKNIFEKTLPNIFLTDKFFWQAWEKWIIYKEKEKDFTLSLNYISKILDIFKEKNVDYCTALLEYALYKQWKYPYDITPLQKKFIENIYKNDTKITPKKGKYNAFQ